MGISICMCMGMMISMGMIRMMGVVMGGSSFNGGTSFSSLGRREEELDHMISERLPWAYLTKYPVSGGTDLLGTFYRPPLKLQGNVILVSPPEGGLEQLAFHMSFHWSFSGHMPYKVGTEPVTSP